MCSPHHYNDIQGSGSSQSLRSGVLGGIFTHLSLSFSLFLFIIYHLFPCLVLTLEIIFNTNAMGRGQKDRFCVDVLENTIELVSSVSIVE